MSEQVLMQIIIGLLMVVIGMLKWGVNRIFFHIDGMKTDMRQAANDHAKEILEIHKAMKAGDDVLHDRITGACGRITKLEAIAEFTQRA